MTALVFTQIPDTDVSAAVAADKFALVRMNNHIVDRITMVVVSLHGSGLGIPDLDCPVLRACNHPFRVAVKPDAGDVACVAFKNQNRVWVGALDFVKFDSVVPRGGKVLLIG